MQQDENTFNDYEIKNGTIHRFFTKFWAAGGANLLSVIVWGNRIC